MDICKHVQCTGCGACYSKCPTNSITMVEDSEGFLRPQINDNTCTNCGLCKKICPANNEAELKTPSKVFAAWDNNKSDKAKSSSGGLATLLAKKVLENGGAVCGAVFSDDITVRHAIITDVCGLDKLRGSKYVQSIIGDCFKEINELLKNGTQVLFVGTPCQVSGLKSYVGKNDSLLFTVDLICHGTPSQKTLHSYIDELNKKYNANIDSCSFRNTNGFNLSFLENEKTIQSVDFTLDLYGIAFLKGLFYRPACYQCKYAQSSRCGDVTLGDFWGIGQDFIDSYHPENGISVAMINTDKGQQLISRIKDDSFMCERELSEAVNGNKQLRFPSHMHKNRQKFFAKLPQKGFTKSAQSCLAKEMIGYKVIKIINKVKK